jgi:DNA-binding Lrp family transcriptional regulator
MGGQKMNDREIRIIDELRKNSRRPLTDLAKVTDTPLSTVFKTLATVEKRAIKKHACIVDFKQLGYPFKVGMFLATGNKTELTKLLENHPNLNTLLRLSGDYDFYAELIFKDMAQYQNFMDEGNDSELLNKMSIHFVTDVKQEEFQIGKKEVSENEKEY